MARRFARIIVVLSVAPASAFWSTSSLSASATPTSQYRYWASGGDDHFARPEGKRSPADARGAPKEVVEMLHSVPLLSACNKKELGQIANLGTE